MNITFLGTGTSQGIPVIGSQHSVCLSSDKKDKRLRVSVLVEWENYSYVVDCGPDFRYQMLRANCSKIDGIIFTHEHSDHVAGLDDLRPFYFRQGDIPIYAHKRVLKALQTRYDYFFKTEDKYFCNTSSFIICSSIAKRPAVSTMRMSLPSRRASSRPRRAVFTGSPGSENTGTPT